MIVHKIITACNGHFRKDDPRKKTLKYLALRLRDELTTLETDGQTSLLDKSKWTQVSSDEVIARTAFGQIEMLERLLGLDPETLKTLSVADLVTVIEAINAQILGVKPTVDPTAKA